jgi:hypothetical protein
MSDDVKQAIADLQSFVVCRCAPAYTGRKLRDPDCYCGYAPEVKAVADHIKELEAKLLTAAEERGILLARIEAQESANADLLRELQGQKPAQPAK